MTIVSSRCVVGGKDREITIVYRYGNGYRLWGGIGIRFLVLRWGIGDDSVVGLLRCFCGLIRWGGVVASD